jgi:hypothetical protein
MLGDNFEVLTGTAQDFTSAINYRNFCWSFLSFFVAPWFFFFLWHYPFYLAVEEQTTEESSLGGLSSMQKSRILVRQHKGNRPPVIVGYKPRESEQMTPRHSPTNNDNDEENDEQHLEQEAQEQEEEEEEEGETTNLLNNINNQQQTKKKEVVSTVTEKETLIPMYKTWFSSFGAIAYFCFCVLQFAGANFLAASGVGFLVSVKKQFDSNLEAAGTSTTLNSNSYWVMIALPLAATCIWGILMLVTLTWILIIFRRKWKESGRKFGVIFMIILLVASLVFLLLWVLVWDRHEFFPPSGDYSRSICVKNSCSGIIRVMSTGGSSGINCNNGCPFGTVCNTNDNLCYFSISRLTVKGLILGPGGRQCIPFDYSPMDAQTLDPGTGQMTKMNIQWSGAIYASGGCEAGGANCKTGMCDNCPAYVGPTGPVTQAEMTLSANQTGPDFYDVTIINGMNFPMKITPQFNPSYGKFQDNLNGATPMYYCQNPGDTNVNLNAEKSDWQFMQRLAALGNTNYFPLVDVSPPNSGSQCPCSNTGETCGTAMVLVQDGNTFKPTQQVQQQVCGKLIGYWTDNELCTWTAGSFGNCNTQASDGLGTLTQLYGCEAPYGQSCLQTTATPSCCGCSVWNAELGLTAANGFKCYAFNNAWVNTVKPRLQPFKAGCPTCYVYPYDDATSTFTCRGNGTANDNSYEIEWCPGGVELG